ncbi:hypothetical protein ACGF8B_28420 [Streptomyces sp. NPDC047917]|uniref:hypothetical protein n=1 Tax=Streptomyces sp. NPDC047917 TaxID=3365491 RepID=UPI00371C3E29
MRNASSAKPVAPPVPWKPEDRFTGPTADGRVVAFRDKHPRFIAPEERDNNVSMPTPPGLLHLDGHRLTVESKGVRQSSGLRPEAQFRALRDAAGRDRTAARRELLPNGAPDDRRAPDRVPAPGTALTAPPAPGPGAVASRFAGPTVEA